MEQALSTDRVVRVHYTRDNQPRRGSGLRIGGRHVLTADHCADGQDHRVEVDGRAYRAEVKVRSHTPQIDVAVLAAEESLAELPWLEYARIDRMVVGEVTGCVAVGFPWWKTDGVLTAQVTGTIPTSEGIDPGSPPGTVTSLSMKIANQAILDPRSDPTEPDSPWRGMSGAVVCKNSMVLGVVRGHVGVEGTRSLTLTPLEAVEGLASQTATAFWIALGIRSVGDLRPLRPEVNQAFDPVSIVLEQQRWRLNNVSDLYRRGELCHDAFVMLQVDAVKASW
jgi:hypothetical protein